MTNKKIIPILLTIVLLMMCISSGTGLAEFSGIEQGDFIEFGTYPQTSDGTDDSPIEWLVLIVQDDPT